MRRCGTPERRRQQSSAVRQRRFSPQSHSLIDPSHEHVATLLLSSGCHSTPMQTWSCALIVLKIFVVCAAGSGREQRGLRQPQRRRNALPAASRSAARLPVPDEELPVPVAGQQVAAVRAEVDLSLSATEERGRGRRVQSRISGSSGARRALRIGQAGGCSPLGARAPGRRSRRSSARRSASCC